MLLSRRHKFVFVHVPKTGGDSIAAALAPLADQGEWDSFEHKHATAAQIRQQWFGDGTWGQFMRFAFVRNPWDRLHSDWQFCRHFGKRLLDGEDIESTPDWLEKCRRTVRQPFADFCRAECCGGSQITTYCTGGRGQLIVNLILRYEDLGDVWPGLVAELGGEGIELPRFNATPNRSDYRQDYDHGTRELVAATFRRDIEFFGYKF